MRLALLLPLLALGLAAEERLVLEVRPPDHRFRFLPELKVPGQRPLVVALRGGSAKGLAHAGVLRRLDEEGWPLSGAVGTSAGSLACALYACGFGGVGSELVFAGIDFSRVIDDRQRTPGLSLAEDEAIHGSLMSMAFRQGRPVLVPGEDRARRLRITLLQVLGRGQALAGEDFDGLGIPVRAVASSLTKGEERVLGKGDLVDAVQASMTIPGLLAPVHLGGEQLVDGGLVENLPAMAARAAFPGAVVMGVHIGRPWDPAPASDVFSLLSKSLDLSMRITETRSEKAAELVVRPDTAAVPEFDYKGQEPALFAAGARALDAVLPELDRHLLPPGSEVPVAESLHLEGMPEEVRILVRSLHGGGPWSRAAFWRLLRQLHRKLPTGAAEVVLPEDPAGRAILRWTAASEIRELRLELPPHWREETRSEVARGLEAAGLAPGRPFHATAFGLLEQRLLAAGIERGVSVLDLADSGFEDGVLRLRVKEPVVARLRVEPGEDAATIQAMLRPLEGHIARASDLEHALGRTRERLGLQRLEARLECEPDGLALRLLPVSGKPTVLNLNLAYETDWGTHLGLMAAGRNLLGSGVAGQLDLEADALQKRAGLHLAWVPRRFPLLQLGAFGSWVRQEIMDGLLPGTEGPGPRELVRREAGVEALARWGWEDRGRIGLAAMVQDGRYGLERAMQPTGRAQVARIWAEWDNRDFHTLPREGTSIRFSLDRSLAVEAGQLLYWRSYLRAHRVQPLGRGWGFTADLEAGLERHAPVDRWWVMGGSASIMGTRSASILMPNTATLRLGLPYTVASLLGSGWQVGPRLDVGRAALTLGGLREQPVRVTGYGLVARSVLRDFFVELAVGRVAARLEGRRHDETRASFLIGARPFDPWKRK